MKCVARADIKEAILFDATDACIAELKYRGLKNYAFKPLYEILFLDMNDDNSAVLKGEYILVDYKKNFTSCSADKFKKLFRIVRKTGELEDV